MQLKIRNYFFSNNKTEHTKHTVNNILFLVFINR